MGGGGGELLDIGYRIWKNTAAACRSAEAAMDAVVEKSSIGRYFKLRERGSSFTREVRAGTATFLTMAYIITVNATILADSGGTCSSSSKAEYHDCLQRTKSDLVVATVLSSMIGSFSMGVIANLPLGLAPAMGANAYLAYDLVGFHGSKSLSYQSAMTIVLLEGSVFFLISAVGLRAKLAKLIPNSVRLASAAGIGLFIAFVGLQSHQGVGLVGPDASTLVTLAACSRTNQLTGECLAGKLQNPKFWLGFVGFLITCYSLMKNIKGSMIYGIVFVTFVSWFRDTDVTYFPRTAAGDASFTYFKKIIDFHGINTTAGAYNFGQITTGGFLVAFVTLLYVDMISTTATLYTMAEVGEFVNEKGDFEGQYAAFLVDSSSTIVGSSLGVSTVTVYVESSAGLKEGGKTGITAITISFYFLVSLFFLPMLTSVPPWAVGPSLVAVGLLMMMKVVKDINWSDVKEAAPAFVTMLLMPLTYSISNGIVAGIVLYAVLSLVDYGAGMIHLIVNVRRIGGCDQSQVSDAAGAVAGV